MLKQRVITALVIAAIVISALIFLDAASMSALLGAAVVVCGWEWSRLAGFQSLPAQLAYAALVAVCMLVLWVVCGLGGSVDRDQVQAILGLAGLWWAIALLWVKGYPGSAALWGTLPMLSLMGLLVLAPAWLAVAFLLSHSGGAWLLLVLALVVACADIGAYFSGKQFGKRKLALNVSPGKSWEGVYGGLAACSLLALIIWLVAPQDKLGLPGILAIVLSTAMVSVLGDLLVSMAKRHRGFKDSSQLLPGHGGFLDRLDGYTAAAPVFALGLILAAW